MDYSSRFANSSYSSVPSGTFMVRPHSPPTSYCHPLFRKTYTVELKKPVSPCIEMKPFVLLEHAHSFSSSLSSGSSVQAVKSARFL